MRRKARGARETTSGEPAQRGGGEAAAQRAPSGAEELVRIVGNQAAVQLLRGGRGEFGARSDAATGGAAKRYASSLGSEVVRRRAEAGVRGVGQALPHLDRIQRSFGAHDLGGVRAYTDRAAALASTSIGARAYASGTRVAFASPRPSLHEAAHEAAHVIQQRAGVALYGGVGSDGDPHERQADQVADAVVRGESAEALLGPVLRPRGGGPAPIQRKVGFELEFILPMVKLPDKARAAEITGSRASAPMPDDVLAFLDGGCPGKEPIKSADKSGGLFRIETDHIGHIYRPWMRILDTLKERKYLDKSASISPFGKICDMEYVTTEQDEVGLGADAVFAGLFEAVRKDAAEVQEAASHGELRGIPGGEPGVLVGVPRESLRTWLDPITYKRLDPDIKEIETHIADGRFYLQATTGIFPSALARNLKRGLKFLEPLDDKSQSHAKFFAAKANRRKYGAMDRHLLSVVQGEMRHFDRAFKPDAKIRATFEGMTLLAYAQILAGSAATAYYLRQEKNRYAYMVQAHLEVVNNMLGDASIKEQLLKARLASSRVVSKRFAAWSHEHLSLTYLKSMARRLALNSALFDEIVEEEAKEKGDHAAFKRRAKKTTRRFIGAPEDLLAHLFAKGASKIRTGPDKGKLKGSILQTGNIKPDEIDVGGDEEESERLIAVEHRHILAYPRLDQLSGYLGKIIDHVREVNLESLSESQRAEILERVKKAPPPKVIESKKAVKKKTAPKGFDPVGDSWRDIAAKIPAVDRAAGLVVGMQRLSRLKQLRWEGVSAAQRAIERFAKGQEIYESNCWGAVILAALSQKLIDLEYAKEAVKVGVLPKAVIKNATGSLVFDDDPVATDEEILAHRRGRLLEVVGTIPAGDVVIIGSSGVHVAVSVGGGRIIELDKRDRDLKKKGINPDHDKKVDYAKAISESQRSLKLLEESKKALLDDGNEAPKLERAESLKLVKRELKRVSTRLTRLNFMRSPSVMMKGALNEVQTVDLAEVIYLSDKQFIDTVDGVYWGPLPEQVEGVPTHAGAKGFLTVAQGTFMVKTRKELEESDEYSAGIFTSGVGTCVGVGMVDTSGDIFALAHFDDESDVEYGLGAMVAEMKKSGMVGEPRITIDVGGSYQKALTDRVDGAARKLSSAVELRTLEGLTEMGIGPATKGTLAKIVEWEPQSHVPGADEKAIDDMLKAGGRSLKTVSTPAAHGKIIDRWIAAMCAKAVKDGFDGADKLASEAPTTWKERAETLEALADLLKARPEVLRTSSWSNLHVAILLLRRFEASPLPENTGFLELVNISLQTANYYDAIKEEPRPPKSFVDELLAQGHPELESAPSLPDDIDLSQDWFEDEPPQVDVKPALAPKQEAPKKRPAPKVPTVPTVPKLVVQGTLARLDIGLSRFDAGTQRKIRGILQGLAPPRVRGSAAELQRFTIAWARRVQIGEFGSVSACQREAFGGKHTEALVEKLRRAIIRSERKH